MLLRPVQGTYSFPAAYYSIYVRDLPLLVTTDSILHAVHRTFDSMLEETETRRLVPTLREILSRSHAELANHVEALSEDSLENSLRDVDLYLTVARNLIAGLPHRRGKPIPSVTGQDELVGELLQLIQASQELKPVSLYGSQRLIDFTQFKPRGRYTSYQQSLYFRTMMWLGRADCGWQIAPNPETGLRELRNAVLLNLLLEAAECDAPMADIDQFLSSLVGLSNGLSSIMLRKVMPQESMPSSLDKPPTQEELSLLSERLQQEAHNLRSVRSEASPGITPVARWQMIGQRFAIDAFILSQLVYDAIEDQGEYPKRMLPSPLDVMASLGNPLAVELLRPEITRWRCGTVWAASQLIGELDKDFWEQNFYNGWLKGLQLIHREFADYESIPNAPQPPLAAQAIADSAGILGRTAARLGSVRRKASRNSTANTQTPTLSPTPSSMEV